MEVRPSILSCHCDAADENRRHVYQDLHSYCCTFERCPTANRLYSSRRSWFAHELEIHRTSFHCIDTCNYTFAKEVKFQAHVRKCHPELAEPHIYSALKQTSFRSANLEDPATCKLCDARMSLRQLRRHLGHHQEQLALFVLPSALYEADDDTEEFLMDQISVEDSDEDSIEGADEDYHQGGLSDGSNSAELDFASQDQGETLHESTGLRDDQEIQSLQRTADEVSTPGQQAELPVNAQALPISRHYAGSTHVASSKAGDNIASNADSTSTPGPVVVRESDSSTDVSRQQRMYKIQKNSRFLIG